MHKVVHTAVAKHGVGQLISRPVHRSSGAAVHSGPVLIHQPYAMPG